MAKVPWKINVALNDNENKKKKKMCHTPMQN